MVSVRTLLHVPVKTSSNWSKIKTRPSLYRTMIEARPRPVTKTRCAVPEGGEKAKIKIVSGFREMLLQFKRPLLQHQQSFYSSSSSKLRWQDPCSFRES